MSDAVSQATEHDSGTPLTKSKPAIVSLSDEDVQIEIQKRRRVLSSRVLAGSAFRVNTPVCQLLLIRLKGWLEFGEFGALISGWPRLGKTAAARWALEAIQRRPFMSCWIPWAEVPCRGTKDDEVDPLSDEKRFFRYLLNRINYRYRVHDDVGTLRSQLTKHIVSKARRSEIRTFVLFFDEAHKLRQCHYEWLLEVSNEVNQAECRLFCVLVGQPELLQRKAELEDAGAEQLLDRFMLRDFDFRGLQSEVEVLEVLAAFNEVIYPANSDTRFPQYYVPHLCDAGFRLEDLGPSLWKAFCSAWTSEGLPGTPEVSMGHLTKALIHLLNAQVRKPPEGLISVQEIQNAVEHSRFAKVSSRRFSKTSEHDSAASE